MDTAGQDKHLFILESYRAEVSRPEKIDSGMYMSALNTVLSLRPGRVELRGVETLTASLQDVRISLMPSDMAGIYNSRGELTRPAVAHTVPKSQLHCFRRNSGKLHKHLKLSLVSLKDTIKYSATCKLNTCNVPSDVNTINQHLSVCVLINHVFYKLHLWLCVGAGWLAG